MTALWPHQQQGVDDVLYAIAEGRRRILLTSPTGGGKCLGRGTPVLMFDGSVRPVEEINGGDLLMGPDSQPRTVVSLARGREMMYRVIPTKGDPYTVNESHILSLKLTPDTSGEPHELVNISVLDYLRQSQTFRHRAKGWRTAVEFPGRAVPFDPYFLGLWLGDGTRDGSIEVSKPDEEVLAACSSVAADFGLVVRTQAGPRCPRHRIVQSVGRGPHCPNPLLNAFRSLGLGARKFIPNAYKINSREVRLAVLAGLMDSDGYMHHGGFDFISRDRQLAEDLTFLARSLGLAARLQPCVKTIRSIGFAGNYYRVQVTGDCSVIPTRIARKQAPPRLQKKNPLLTGISVEPVCVDDYFGFELGGPDRLFLLGDFTVTHNTRLCSALVRHLLDRGRKVVWYTNRRLLVEQTSAAVGLPHGVRAAGHPSEPHHPFQISSVQTEAARVLRKTGLQRLHEAHLAVFDEAHLQGGEQAREIMRRHLAAGAAVLGVTATPIGLGDLYDHLVVAGTTSQLRACGALVPAKHYGPDEPDLKAIGRVALGEDLTETQNRKLFPMTQVVFGRVLEWWKRLNPEGKPTILFAPGVAESLWFAEQFEKEGVPAAHIDGQELWFGGETYTTSRGARETILEESRSGRVRVLCNRFVLREGIDAPWLEHGIFACVFGSLQSYLQSGGRLLRASPGKAHCVVQDHGGNWWRHGSLNADRHWALDMTPAMVAGLREERLRNREEREPCRCPRCGMILAGTRCPCGFVVDLTKKSRPVIQSDGTIREHAGDVYRPRVTRLEPDTQELWTRVYYRARKAGMTFRQAEGLFVTEAGYWPPHTLHYMPRLSKDWWNRVDFVKREDLQ